MNVVGQPVAKAMRRTVQTPSRIIVLQDSLKHHKCELKTKFGGSPSGHRGIRSINHWLHSDQDFYRIMLGIGHGSPAKEYVLGPLQEYERAFWGVNGEGTDLVWAELETIAQKVEKKFSEAEQK